MIESERAPWHARIGALLALAATPVCGYGLALVGLDVWATVLGSPTIGDAVVLVACAVGVAVCAILTAMALAMAATIRSRRSQQWLRAVMPRTWRKVVTTALGLAVAGGATTPAFAYDEDPVAAGWLATTESAATAPASNAETVSSPSTQEAPPAPADDPGESETTITVDAGDTLWDITAAHLGEDASAPDIATAWPELYDVNEASIGPNPNIIHPSTELTIPKEWSA